MAREKPSYEIVPDGTRREDDPFAYQGYLGNKPTKTTYCTRCEKRKVIGDGFGRRAALRDKGGRLSLPLCDDCAAREDEARLPDRLVEIHAWWQERLPRAVEFTAGDRREVEGQKLAVTRVNEVEVTESSRLALRVFMQPWAEDRPVPPPRDPEKLAKIREAKERKRKRKTGSVPKADAAPKPEPEPPWPGQRFYARDKGGRETEVRALRNSEAALPVRVGQRLIAPPRKGARNATFVVVAVLEDGDRVVMERD